MCRCRKVLPVVCIFKSSSLAAALTRKSLAHEFEYSPIISQLIDSERRPGRCETNDHFLSGLEGLSPYHRSAGNHPSRTFEVQVKVPKLEVKLASGKEQTKRALRQ